MGKYLESFGKVFYEQIARLIDEAFALDKDNRKKAHETYVKLALTKNIDFENENALKLSEKENYDSLKEFKNFISELGLHANQYNLITSKFFGRDYLTVKVNFFLN